MSVVFWKELADHFSSRRFMILLIIIVLSALWATYATGQAIRQNSDTAPAQYAFLLLLTSSGETVFSLATFLGFFGPLVGIVLGGDHAVTVPAFMPGRSTISSTRRPVRSTSR